jgi:hypothetical protein
MRRLLPTTLAGRLYFAGTALLVGVVVVALLTTRGGSPPPPPVARPPVPTTTAPAPTTTPAPPPTTTPAPTTTAPAPTTTAPPAPPTPVPFSWQNAGGLVWHTSEIDPTVLGEAVRAAGFGWIAVFLADGVAEGPPPPDWIARFRAASGGLPVGGWSVLRTDPVAEAQLAASLVAQDGLAFYVADAEREYGYTDGTTRNPEAYARSQEFVRAFRTAEPTLPAGLSSFCRPDRHDLDWSSWATAGFVFLPQAYVPQDGADDDPAVCVRAAAKWFPPADVFPTLGIFAGGTPTPDPTAYAQLLTAAGTTGFSLFPAEDATALWPAYGAAIQTLGVAIPVPSS